MADDWAAFKTSQSAEKRGGDDEWADFGGFESASPSSNPFGENSVAAAFPWTTAFPAVSQQQAVPTPTNSQPVFPAQTSAFPTSSEHTTSALPAPTHQAQSDNLFLSDPGEYTTLRAPPQSSLPAQHTPSHGGTPTQLPPSFGGVPTNPSPLKSDILSQLPPHGGISTNPSFQVDATSSPLLGAPNQEIINQDSVLNKPNVIPSNGLFISPSREETIQSAPPPIPSREHRQLSGAAQVPVVDEARLNEVQGELKEAHEKVTNYQNQLHVSDEKLSLAEREKIRLEESLEEMKRKCSDATELAKDQYVEIQKQKEQYDQLQDQHEEQLKKLREAGQEAFALIVEEYKELSKTAVVQERENNEKHLQQVLEEEREKFTTFVNQQGENLKLLVREEQANNLKKLEEALEEQKGKHQAELSDCLEEERQRGKKAVEKALEEERARGKVLTEELINNQKKEFENFIAEQKKIFEENLTEERKETAKKIEKVLKDEQERARNDLDEAMAEERHKSRGDVLVIKEKTKEDMGQYIKEKEKADEAVRLRSYQSMDLFLQGVQTQLRSLINNTEIPPSS